MINNHPKLFDNSLGLLLGHAAHALKNALRRALQEAGCDLTPEQWFILALLVENQGVSQRDLAETCQKDVANMARIIDILEKKKFIRRERNDMDRRAYRIYSTAEGSNMINELTPVYHEFRRSVFNVLEPEEQEVLSALLNKIIIQLEQLAP